MLFFRQLQHLLPRSEAWRLTIDKTLRRFLLGVASGPKAVRDFIDNVYAELDPDSTTSLEKWEDQRGLPGNGTEAARRLALAASFRATGGQSPKYLQDVLQDAGYDVYVHEWFSLPGAPVDPRAHVDQRLIGGTQCGQQLAECGEPDAMCSDLLANEPGYLVNDTLTGRAPPKIPDDPDRWTKFIYIGGESFPDDAYVTVQERAQLKEFRRLVLKHFRASNWIVTLVHFVLDMSGGVYERDGIAYFQSADGDPLREAQADETPWETRSGWPHPMLKLQGARANEMVDLQAWNLSGAVTRTSGIDDPLGGNGAFRIEGIGSSLSDSLRGDTPGSPYDADQPLAPSFWLRPITTPATLAIRHPNSTDLGLWHVDLSALAGGWERIHEGHSAVTVVEPWVADSNGDSAFTILAESGDPIDADMFWPQLEPLYASATIEPQETRQQQSYTFAADNVPEVMRSGRWSVWMAFDYSNVARGPSEDQAVMTFSNDDGSRWWQLRAVRGPDVNLLQLSVENQDGEVATMGVLDGIGIDAYAPMRLTLDANKGTLELHGAGGGDGVYSGDPWSIDDDMSLVIGADHPDANTGLAPFSGAMSDPLLRY